MITSWLVIRSVYLELFENEQNSEIDLDKYFSGDDANLKSTVEVSNNQNISEHQKNSKHLYKN